MSSEMRANFPLGNQNACGEPSDTRIEYSRTLIKIMLREIPSARCGGDAASSSGVPPAKHRRGTTKRVCVHTDYTSVHSNSQTQPR